MNIFPCPICGVEVTHKEHCEDRRIWETIYHPHNGCPDQTIGSKICTLEDWNARFLLARDFWLKNWSEE